MDFPAFLGNKKVIDTYLFLLFLRWELHGFICRGKTFYCGTKKRHDAVSGVQKVHSFVQQAFFNVLQQKINHSLNNYVENCPGVLSLE